MNVREFVHEAALLAGLVNPNDEYDGYYVTTAVDLFNDLLASWSRLGVYISTTNKLTFSLTQGEYSFPVSPPILQFMEGNVMSADNILTVLKLADRKEKNYWNYTDAQGTPYRIFIDDDYSLIDLNTQEGSSLVYVYPPPDGSYTLSMTVKQALSQVSTDTINLTLPRTVFKVLKYQLAKDLAIYWQEPLSQDLKEETQRLIDELKASVPKDLRVNINNPLLSWRLYRPFGGTIID